MIGFEKIWGWLLVIVLGLSANLRNAVIAKGVDLKNLAKSIAAFTLNMGKWWVDGLLWLLIFLFIPAIVGIWVPVVREVVLVLLAIWFLLLVWVSSAIAGILAATPALPAVKKDGNEVIPEIPLDDLGKGIADALRLGTKPVLYILALLGCGIILSLAFPGIPSGIATFIFGTVVVVMASRGHEGKPASLKWTNTFIAVCIIAFAMKMVFPGANDWLNQVAKGAGRRITSSSAGKSVRNEPFARFTANRYIWQLGLTDKTAVPIFDKDGQPVSYKAKILGEIDEKLVILLNQKIKPPKATELAGIEFSKIQNPADTQQYIVPRRCIDSEIYRKGYTPLECAAYNRYSDEAHHRAAGELERTRAAAEGGGP